MVRQENRRLNINILTTLLLYMGNSLKWIETWCVLWNKKNQII